MIPDYQTLMRPVLEAAKDEPRKISDVVEEISDLFELTEEEREDLLPSGTQTRMRNRVHWARSYLKQAALVHNVRRGWYELTDRGRAALEDPSQEINVRYLKQFAEFQDFRNRTHQNGGNDTEAQTEQDDVTPDESLQEAHERLNAALASSLLEAARNASPAFFESLIVSLFVAMGYGGSAKNTGRALGKSGDDGIDGVIDQDPLGVDQIYLQAKRYASQNSVGSHHIRDFFGALNIKRAQKGIFVTTSYFTPSAIRTAQDLGSRIVLIDGQQLSELMIRYNIGCTTKELLEVKEVDESFFEE